MLLCHFGQGEWLPSCFKVSNSLMETKQSKGLNNFIALFFFLSLFFAPFSSFVSLTESPSYCANEEEEGGGYKVNSLALASMDRIFRISANFALNPPLTLELDFVFPSKREQ